jgi:hypothetical protein
MAILMAVFWGGAVLGQSSSGSVNGTVTDSTGAVIPGATVVIANPASGYSHTTTSDQDGQFHFYNLAFDPYRLSIHETGFQTFDKVLDISSGVPLSVPVKLQVATSSQTVTVEAQTGAVSTSPTFHTDIDRGSFDKLPLESQSSSLSSLVTLASPGVAADSNGLFHGLGDHASNSFSIDGQPITDQQSKVFSNQIPSNSVQSIEVIEGAPPAEYGGKTSLVIDVTTRSGLGVKQPTGSISTSYGSFGSSTGSFDISKGGEKWGNFFEIDALNTGRFLDSPEFSVFHDKGNEVNTFDRIDRQLSTKGSFHINLNLSRSWFQTPNAFENLNVQDVLNGGTGSGSGTSPNPVFGDVGNTDQRSKIVTFNIAPEYTRTIGSYSVLNFGVYVRRDGYNYYPSNDLFADLGPPNLQNETIAQARSLTNAGLHSDFSYVRGINNIKVGTTYDQTFLRENDTLGIVAPTFNSPCLNTAGTPLPGFTDPTQCVGYGDVANPAFNPVLLPYDLTRDGTQFNFFGHTDVKEFAVYIEDQIKTGNWNFNVGIRGDVYNGLTRAQQAEPRLGAAYTVKKTGTVLRLSYARTLESPFNENLVLSSQGCGNDVLAPLLLCSPGVSTTLQPGFRNEFHAGLQQSFGKYFVVSGEYIWKYTHNAFDFSVLGNTPITFPIDWHNSKIPGYMLHADVPNFHNLSAFVVMSSVAARFFPPQVAGAGATVAQGSVYPFRIDHDEKFNQTTHLQYQIPLKHAPWFSFNWRYDSGLVAGSVPCYNPLSNDPNSACATTSTTLGGLPAVNLSGLTADEEFQAGLACNGVKATPTTPLPAACLASAYTSKLVSIPAPGTGDNDHNPPRIQPRDLFDMALGNDDVFHFHDNHYKFGARVTAINVTDKYALYNFLSTFSGTHYVTPRTVTAQVTLHF